MQYGRTPNDLPFDCGDRVLHREYGKGVVMAWNSYNDQHTFFVHFDGERKQCESEDLTLIDKGYYQRETAKIIAAVSPTPTELYGFPCMLDPEVPEGEIRWKKGEI